ncbi:hypothetical protein CTheo_1299 [Ceratobasidium theobromae]|uniref:SHSP domain-containing protein n=1 Tax=Ceratobasidium theobromae TaxID=1582974 RepID=A0A5N5QUH0_9AGAM|nr:hypothetical protein CTheo_1299 [Ceratobasidium theobromae]
MSLAHFLAEYATHPFEDPYYDHWFFDNTFGTHGNVWQPDWSSFQPTERTPPLDWYDEDTKYTLQLEVPGVRKEDLSMHVSDDGRMLTIEGKTEKYSGPRQLGSSSGEDGGERRTTSRIKRVRKVMVDGSTVIISRTEKKHSVSTVVKFSRTVSLPGYIDGKRISAKLENGVLTVSIPKLPTPKPRRVVID